ncbi:hypothetical protein BN59_01908 [Legionella massiliensis]|uniref:Uncharacterized protein n=1 Tax=Legionella massiliensis TaxID=1034943 RepID=A0A078L0P9_9GAMM|nr:hypothetical protein [Legionella massiliensis]CDZ77624.1 hypothetical protein BN59_01908 [Legionella massiliensis]CEE13362.1 hypothetical protein BN1094_01908 [Legionella massiliensis]
MTKGPLFDTPEAVKRQGENLFVKCPLYRSKESVRPIYINKELFQQFIADTDASWEQMSATLSELFSLTLKSEESSGEQIGWAYVDRQSDPLNLSLSGNEGSGRAYYTGKNFNIKGEKTPLATSSEINHSNGVLAMQDGIWSCLIANSLYPNGKVTPVLAVLDINEVYNHPTKHSDLARVKIIRLDLDGSLDRITHLFQLKKSLSKDELLAMAAQFGQLDAYKFMQRIVHGSWSNGNISPHGHLIDYDSVCAVKGRQPQFSLSSYYIDNYFSFEYVGKQKVLESLINDPQTNIEQVQFAEVSAELIAARNQDIAKLLLDLMGFSDPKLFSNYNTELYDLAQQLINLSRYVRYSKERSFYTNTPFHFFAHIFDFSTLFRYFALLKLNERFDLDAGFALLVESELIPEDETIDIAGDFIEEPLEPRVLAYLQDCFINSEEQIIRLKNEAYTFIEAFNALFDRLIISSHLSVPDVAKQAYLVNEDRFYLFPVFDLSKKITKIALSQSAEQANDLIGQIIRASRRPAERADFRLYIEGITYIEFSGKETFQIVFELKKQSLNLELADLTISFNAKTYKASSKIVNTDTIKIESAAIDMRELLVSYPRDEVFKLRKYELLAGGNVIRLQDYLRVDPKLKYYL